MLLRLRLAAVLLLLAAPLVAARGATPSGQALPGLEAYDAAMTGLLQRWGVAGGSLAVARHGKLVLARGYGLADTGQGLPVEPTSRFRLASLSKTITAVAVLQLVEQGHLGLDAPVLPLLGALGPRPERISDPRVRAITVRHLLQHSGGFDRKRSGDVVFPPYAPRAAERQGAPLPPDCATILRDTLEGTLDFAPGTRFAYSNIGYCVLGRVIEQVSGQRYEAFVRERVLQPAGAERLLLGRTLQAAEGEVRYYDYPGARQVAAMPGLGLVRAPQPYGRFAMETQDAFGGWIGAPVDYLAFILAIEGARGPALLGGASLAAMRRPSGLPSASDGESESGGSEYGLGIRIRAVKGGGQNLWHTGSLPGTSTLAVRSADGVAWVAAFNGRPQDRNAFRRDLDRSLWQAKRSVRNWPTGDLFAALPR